MPGGGGAAASSSAPLPYGGPPAMPKPPDPSMFGRGGPSSAPSSEAARLRDDQRARRPSDVAENKVLVDLGLEVDAGKLEAEVKSLRGDLEKANASFEREVADGKRVRAEAATLRERIEELRAQVKDREEQISAHDRVADELRDELTQTRNDLAKVRNDMGEMAENMVARERQAARAVEDTAKLRDDMEDLNRQLMELSRTKDEGWKKLNDQLTEIEHLREVINEQERMLEERRVGLISQEEVIKELRADKERNLKVIAQLKAERDEAATTSSRQAAEIVALEEDHRRLGRLLAEAQTDSSRGGGDVDHQLRVQNELKETRVELKKVEADRDRLDGQHAQADRDREKLEGRLAQIEVELQEALHGKLAAESARNVAQDALAKAEVARHRAAEEALAASKARDQASTGDADQRRELDRMRRRVADLEKVKAAAGPSVDPKELQHERETFERKLQAETDKAAAAERALKSLQAEIDAVKMDALKARGEAARAKAAADSQAEVVVDTGGARTGELARVAGEVYEAINDILSELRNNMVLVQGELPNMQADPARMEAVQAAVDAMVDGAENAKGALRGLRDLAKPAG
jgi:chromosome segregation ATPase